MARRFVTFQDKFDVVCHKCGSKDVDVHTSECGECGSHITAECNNCKSKFDYHAFEEEEGEYIDGKFVRKEMMA